MEEKQTLVPRDKLKVIIPIVAAIVVALGVVLTLYATAPYALAMDGEKVKDPWAVTVGGEEVFVVASEEEGKAIIKGVKKAYATEGAKVVDATIEPQMKVVEKDLKRGQEPPQITETKDAVEQVIAANQTAEPMVVVSLTEEVSKEEEIEFETTYEETSKLYVGEEKVLTEGVPGKQTVVTKVTKQNGAVLNEEVVSTTVDVEPTPEVVQKGTKRMNAAVATDVVNNGGVAMGVGSGSSIANYALQFVGNPYKYGGTSLTGGADCSGFTQAVYAQFGISLPRTSTAQRYVGKAVSYSEARPGDIICYSGHVGIYIGGGKIVHASTPASGICVGPATYKSIITVRRLVE